MKKLTNDEFIYRCKEKHPDLTILEKYKNYKTPILIKDSLNIQYKISPGNLLQGARPNIKNSINKNLCFIAKANKIHNNYYNYSKVNYISFKHKIIITCPEHGDFLQNPGTHLKGSGCTKCANLRVSNHFLLSKEEILERFKEKHNDSYIYLPFEYKGISTKINIICKIHGIFTQTVQIHLTSKCPKCSKTFRYDTKSYIERVKEIHKNKYNYSLVEYTNMNSKIIIKCPKHGKFTQRASTHLSSGCPKCALNCNSKSNWLKACTKTNKSLLYIIQILDKKESFIKIGITSRSLQKRLAPSVFPYKYKIVKIINDTPENIWNKEKYLHRNLKDYKYIPLKSFGGKSECFTPKILENIKQLI